VGRRGRGWVDSAVPAPLLKKKVMKKSDVYIIVVVDNVVYIVIVYSISFIRPTLK